MLTLRGQGHEEDARLLYIDIIDRTGNPEYMDAVADIYAARHDMINARRWTVRARAVYEERLALYPEAAGGHALDHFLQHDPARAVQLAEINRDARPGGEAQVKLAEAYLGVGRVDDARETIERVLATDWNTAELHVVAARIYQRAGSSARASEERQRAVLLNPHATVDERSLD